MSKPSYLHKNSIYFGHKSGCLDMHCMKYRIFGAVWKQVEDTKYILGYWFADTENDIRRAIQRAGFSAVNKSQKGEIDQIYQAIRAEQDKENWTKRQRLQVLLWMRKPWKELSAGWYVLKSGNDFPMALTCIQKKRYSIWIEHIKVCETEEDVLGFLNLVNLEHQINLIPEILGNQFCKQMST